MGLRVSVPTFVKTYRYPTVYETMGVFATTSSDVLLCLSTSTVRRLTFYVQYFVISVVISLLQIFVNI